MYRGIRVLNVTRSPRPVSTVSYMKWVVPCSDRKVEDKSPSSRTVLNVLTDSMTKSIGRPSHRPGSPVLSPTVGETVLVGVGK